MNNTRAANLLLSLLAELVEAPEPPSIYPNNNVDAENFKNLLILITNEVTKKSRKAKYRKFNKNIKLNLSTIKFDILFKFKKIKKWFIE